MMTGMDASYAAFSRTQAEAARALVPLFTRAVQRAVESLSPMSRVFCATELGVADGANSAPFVRAILSAAAGRVDDVVLTLLDLPATNWGALATATAAWVRAGADVGITLHIRFAPQSLYDAFAAPGSQCVVYSSTTLHWASHGGAAKLAALGGVGHPLHFIQATRATPPAEQCVVDAWAALAAHDADTVLARVAAALCPGGVFVASVPSRVPPGVGRSEYWWHDLFIDLSELVGRTLVLPVHGLTGGEWVAALARQQHAPRLALAAPIETAAHEDLYWRDAASAQDYASAYMAAVRAVLKSVLAPPLVADPSAVLCELERRARARFDAGHKCGATAVAAAAAGGAVDQAPVHPPDGYSAHVYLELEGSASIE